MGAGSFELYVLRGDLETNPIPERAADMRIQAVDEDGLCAFDIPAYNATNDTDIFLNTIVSSVTGADCSITVCRSAGCHKCEDETTCVLCDTSSDCDASEGEVLEYRYCNCDAVATVNEIGEFTLITGEKKCDLTI